MVARFKGVILEAKTREDTEAKESLQVVREGMANPVISCLGTELSITEFVQGTDRLCHSLVWPGFSAMVLIHPCAT
jgi:hypothetical protein